LSPASYRGRPGSLPQQSMYDLWWIKWHGSSFSLEHFGSPLSFKIRHSAVVQQTRNKPLYQGA
jgi:hypothetical protein